ncbi:hypothetical protein BDV30DRAFT_216976 [Aspergillus minisclerotigenes]|uniref:Uncharacterized protein n=1 Tax=Aspergillus minisclerotigenes TaxID=656917 RepID=A0A5N6IRT1_9EURO|nr:hypothetical protein BDV30DRAFT_216976 [Aspergillus minisclerotigenes]
MALDIVEISTVATSTILFLLSSSSSFLLFLLLSFLSFLPPYPHARSPDLPRILFQDVIQGLGYTITQLRRNL